MRFAPQFHRRLRKKASRIRHRRQSARRFDLPQSADDEEEDVVAIGGGPADDKPAASA